MNDMRTKGGRFPLRLALPTLLVAFLCVDLASRFISYDAIAFRAWEAVTTKRLVTRMARLFRPSPHPTLGIFEPNLFVEIDRAYGDLASMSNRPWMREYHRERFSTDELGFRNKGKPSDRHVGLVLGTSFTAGSTLSDDETLPAQLSALVGGSVYNAGLGGSVYNADLFGGEDFAKLDLLLDSVNLAPGSMVVFEHLEKSDAPELPHSASPPPTSSTGGGGRLRRELDRVKGLMDKLDEIASFSPFRIVLRRWRSRLENDKVFPNSSAERVEIASLRNGDKILLSPSERALSEDKTRSALPGVAFWRFLKERLARRGLRLFVVLVPTQYSIYAPLTTEARPPVHGPLYLAEALRALRAAEIGAIDSSPTLADAASQGLANRHYVYWRDDTHWNKEGVSLVARAIAKEWAPGP